MHADKDATQPAQEGSTTDQAYRGGGDVISRGGGDIISKEATPETPKPETDNDSQKSPSVRTPF